MNILQIYLRMNILQIYLKMNILQIYPRIYNILHILQQHNPKQTDKATITAIRTLLDNGTCA